MRTAPLWKDLIWGGGGSRSHERKLCVVRGAVKTHGACGKCWNGGGEVRGRGGVSVPTSPPVGSSLAKALS